MKGTDKLKYIVLGVGAALLVSTGVVPAVAAMANKTLTVSTGVTVLVDDPTKLSLDSGVEAFIYNGTTYLPVKAMSDPTGTETHSDRTTKTMNFHN